MCGREPLRLLAENVHPRPSRRSRDVCPIERRVARAPEDRARDAARVVVEPSRAHEHELLTCLGVLVPFAVIRYLVAVDRDLDADVDVSAMPIAAPYIPCVRRYSRNAATSRAEIGRSAGLAFARA